MPAIQAIAGDVGGTKTVLALAEGDGRNINFTSLKRYESASFKSLDVIITDFMADASLKAQKTHVTLGIAGAVKNGICRTTNLPWHVDEREIEKKLGLKKVNLINDFEAVAYSIPCLKKEDLLTLNEGEEKRNGHLAIIGAGTGLGEGLSCFSPESGSYYVLPSEGGHSTLSPTNEEELELVRCLMKEFGHVSFERALSGPGLYNIFRFLTSTGRAEATDEALHRIEQEDPAVVISSLGLAGSDKACVKALQMFASLYGNEAGNLALKFLPRGGLYIGGGMAPRLRDKLADGTFMEAFLNKGRMSPLLKSIPVRLILNADAGLKGAALRGGQLMEPEN